MLLWGGIKKYPRKSLIYIITIGHNVVSSKHCHEWDWNSDKIVKNSEDPDYYLFIYNNSMVKIYLNNNK